MSHGVVAFLALGSNLGDRRRAIDEACRLLREDPGIESLRLSTVRETEPVGTPGAPALGGPYLNAVAEVSTQLGAMALLRLCQRIERQLGRARSVRNAPRSIDLDILLYGRSILTLSESDSAPALMIPHPRMLERAFVMEPLTELAPEVIHPVSGKRARDHWEELQRREAN